MLLTENPYWIFVGNIMYYPMKYYIFIRKSSQSRIVMRFFYLGRHTLLYISILACA